MGVELGSGVAIDRAGGVMLELCGDEFAGGFGGVVAADPRLGVPLQLRKGGGHRLPVGLSHPLIAADKAVKETDLGAENVASQPARCSTGLTVVPSAVV